MRKIVRVFIIVLCTLSNPFTNITIEGEEPIFFKKEPSTYSINSAVSTEGKYDTADLELLARLVHGEAGGDFVSDEQQKMVACVVLNRMKDERFPSSLKDVIYEKGQYACVDNGKINEEATERERNNVMEVLNGSFKCPENIVWQSEFPQGKGAWRTYETCISKTYFCY